MFKTNHTPWNKSLKGWTNGTKAGFQKDNKIWLGKKHKKVTKLKVSLAQKGRKHTARQGFQVGHKINIGDKNPMKRPEIKAKLSGKNHYLWKGTTPLAKQIRNCFVYRQWRSDIFTRDDFTCQFCGQRGYKIHADHYPETFSSLIERLKIKTLTEAINCEELWNINNGRTLCIPCHQTTDTYGFKKGK